MNREAVATRVWHRRNQRVHVHDQIQLNLFARVAYEEFRCGRGTVQHWETLGAHFSIAQNLIKKGLCLWASEPIEAAISALKEVREKAKATGDYTLNERLDTAINVGCTWTEKMLSTIYKADFDEVFDKLERDLAARRNPLFKGNNRENSR